MFAGPWQIAIVVLIALVLFGGARIAMVGKGLGEGIRNFRRGLKGDEDPEALPSDSVRKDHPT